MSNFIKYKVTYKRISGSFLWFDTYTKHTKFYGNIQLVADFLQSNVGCIKDINIDTIWVEE